MNKNESPTDVRRWLENQASGALPAILGSLSLRRAPCVRANCPACQSGEQHASWVLYGSVKGRRFSIYIPEETFALASNAGADGDARKSCALFASHWVPLPW